MGTRAKILDLVEKKGFDVLQAGDLGLDVTQTVDWGNVRNICGYGCHVLYSYLRC
jgi:hypothetical protein